MAAIGNGDADQMIAFIQIHCNNARLTRIGKINQRRFLHGAKLRRHEHKMICIKFFHRQHGVDFFVDLHLHQIDDGFTTAGTTTLGHFVNFKPKRATAIGKGQDGVVSIGDEQIFDEVIIFRRSGLFATSAAVLRGIVCQGLCFDVAAMGQGHHDVFRRDEIFHAHLLAVGDDFRATLIAKLLLNIGHFRTDHGGDARGAAEYIQQVDNLLHHFAILLNNLVLL